MTIKIILEEEIVFLNYSINDKEIKEKLDYNAIEKLIDFIMENNIDNVLVSDNELCNQYVDLMRTIISKISQNDFKNSYQEIKKAGEPSEEDSSEQQSDQDIPF